MGQECAQPCVPGLDAYDVTTVVIDTRRLDLSEVNILDFEQRVKQFAHPLNNGQVSIRQLEEAFQGMQIAKQIANPRSIAHKLIVSPFFTNFKLSHNVKKNVYHNEVKEMFLSNVSSEKELLDPSRNPSRMIAASPKGESLQGTPKGTLTDLDQGMRKRTITTENFLMSELWTSVDAIILLGCVHCAGFDSQKAAVFHRVIVPIYDNAVWYNNKDLRKSLFFMLKTATVFEEMTRDMMESPTAPLETQKYELKLKKYKPTYDGIVEHFVDSVFGEFYNRRSREDFIERLAADGWKYFNIRNLNELFTIFLEQCGTAEITEAEENLDIEKEHFETGQHPDSPPKALIISPQPSAVKFMAHKAGEQTFKDLSLGSPSPISKFESESQMGASGVKDLKAVQSLNVIDLPKSQDVTSPTPPKRSLKVISHKVQPVSYKSTGLKTNNFVEKPMLSNKSSNKPTETGINLMTQPAGRPQTRSVQNEIAMVRTLHSGSSEKRFSQVFKPYQNAEQDRLSMEADAEFAQQEVGDEDQPHEPVSVEVVDVEVVEAKEEYQLQSPEQKQRLTIQERGSVLSSKSGKSGSKTSRIQPSKSPSRRTTLTTKTRSIKKRTITVHH